MPSLSIKIAQSGMQCMVDVRTWSPTGSKYSCQSQNQGIIWLRWVFMSFKHHRSSVSLYWVVPLKQWTWPWLCLECICQIGVSDYSCWKPPNAKKAWIQKSNFSLFFVLLSVWAVHSQVGVVWNCKEMPVTNLPILSGDQTNAQYSKAWNRKTFLCPGGQNPWHLPDCVLVLSLNFLPEPSPCQMNSSRQQKVDGCWRNAVLLRIPYRDCIFSGSLL